MVSAWGGTYGVLTVGSEPDHPPFAIGQTGATVGGFTVADDKGDADLLARLDESLALAKFDGNYDWLYEKWFGPYETRNPSLWQLLTYLVPFSVVLLGLVGFVTYQHRGERLRAGEALRESEQRFRDIFENAAIGIAKVSTDGRFLEINKEFCRIIGYTQEEVLSHKLGFQHVTFPDDLGPSLALTKKLLNGVGQSGSLKKRYVRKDGTVVWVELLVQLLKNAEGAPLCFISAVHEITQRRQVEEALCESEFLFRTVFELGNSGIAITSPDKAWLRANPRLCRMLGYSEAELMQHNWAELTHPDDLAADEEQFDRLLAGEIDSYEMDKRFIRKDGETIHTHLTAACYRNDGRDQFVVAGLLDITERKRADEVMKLAALLYQNSSEAMTVTDASGTILDINPAFTRLTGYTADEVIGKNPRILKSGRHDVAFYQEMWQALDTTGRWQGEIWNKRKNGETYAEWLSINTILNEDGSVHRRVAMFFDISERKKSEELIWKQANFDFLTQLPNRSMFHDRLGQEIKKASRAQLPLALLFIDIDRFKEVNDTLGHDMGDLLLKEAAQRLGSCVREVDTVARLGGDEFTVILGGLGDPSSVERIASAILRKLAEPFQLRGEAVYVSGSIGITFYPSDGIKIGELLKNADQAMYDAKRLGRNRYSYFTPAMQEAAQAQMRLANELRGALAGHQFRVFYQPIVELATGKVRTAEALVRWQHPTRGLVSPAEFIPVAEQTGMIVDIGDWVFREAASQAARWRVSHYAEFRVSVNKSSAQFHNQDGKHSAWLAHLTKLGLPAQSIVMEITQGLLLEADDAITDQLAEFHDAGMKISLDDFGAGQSVPAFFDQFKIDYIKIDQPFVGSLSADSEELAVCEAIISMAHKLGMKVVAEGVETAGQRDLLLKAGCDFGQGYLFSKPLSAGEFENLIFHDTRITSPENGNGSLPK
jgi:diguanylate cyclase (GGDEF)-like protein/PAS domain S-box-containing protein